MGRGPSSCGWSTCPRTTKGHGSSSSRTRASDLSGHASSLPWTTLSASSVDIGPQQPADIMVKFKPPANARGYYFAGIVAETPMPENPTGVVVRVRFLIPLIIEIRGAHRAGARGAQRRVDELQDRGRERLRRPPPR